MEAPDNIYVPQHNIEAESIYDLCEFVVGGSVEYIRKDALLGLAKTKLSHLQEDFDVYTGQRLILRELIEKIKSL